MLTLFAVHSFCVVEHSAMSHTRCSICSYLEAFVSQAKVAERYLDCRMVERYRNSHMVERHWGCNMLECYWDYSSHEP